MNIITPRIAVAVCAIGISLSVHAAPPVPPVSANTVAAVAASSRADEDRETLAMISNELARLKEKAQLLGARDRTTSGERVRFEFTWLARDLDMVQRGIDDHLDAPRQPRPIPPLRGDYRR
jgi:RAQPRD family integrative conjugative element protein